MLEQIIEAYGDEDFLIAEGFDEAVLGIDWESRRLVYSVAKCVEILMARDGMRPDEAMEFLEFNTFCAYVGDKTPIWCDDLME